jgi:hypothetical protein
VAEKLLKRVVLVGFVIEDLEREKPILVLWVRRLRLLQRRKRTRRGTILGTNDRVQIGSNCARSKCLPMRAVIERIGDGRRGDEHAGSVDEQDWRLRWLLDHLLFGMAHSIPLVFAEWNAGRKRIDAPESVGGLRRRVKCVASR